jgi:hypothetical protein
MYANMSSEETFLKLVVSDSRSFKIETFDKAIRVLENPAKGIIVSQEVKEKFEIMVLKIKDLKTLNDEEDVRSCLITTV